MTVIGILEGDARPGTAYLQSRLPAGIKPPAGFQTPFTTIKAPVTAPSTAPVTAPSALPSWSTRNPYSPWETERAPATVKPPAYKPPVMVRPDMPSPLVTIDIPKPPQMVLAPSVRPSVMVEEWKPKEIPVILAPRPMPESVFTPPDVFKPPLLEIKPVPVTPGGVPGWPGSSLNFRCRSMPWLPECRIKPGGGGSGPFIPEGSVPGTRPPDIVTPGHNIPPQNPPIMQIPPQNVPPIITPGPSSAPAETPATDAEAGSMKWILPVGAAVLAYFFLEG